MPVCLALSSSWADQRWRLLWKKNIYLYFLSNVLVKAKKIITQYAGSMMVQVVEIIQVFLKILPKNSLHKRSWTTSSGDSKRSWEKAADLFCHHLGWNFADMTLIDDDTNSPP